VIIVVIIIRFFPQVVVESIRLIAGDGALRPHVLACDGVWPVIRLAQVTVVVVVVVVGTSTSVVPGRY
jgi:hypothetical protein